MKLDALREGVIDEHRVALALGGTNDLDNRELWRAPCSKAKTAKKDAPAIGKVKRLRGETCAGPTTTSAGKARKPYAGGGRMTNADLDKAVERVGAFMRVVERQPASAEPFRFEDKVIRDHLSDLRTLLTALSTRDAELAAAREALDECRPFIERYSDWRDGDYGGVEPNEAMQLVHAIDQALGASNEPR